MTLRRSAVFKGAKVAVVVPAFNEVRWIAETLASMPSYVDHVIVVDDASGDATARVASSSGDARVSVVVHPENRGVGAAIITGYRRSLAIGADVTAVMAGDGQMHPDDLEAILVPVIEGRAHYSKGDRLQHPSARRTMPVARRLGTTALAWLTREAAGLDDLADSQCGFTAISARALRTIDLGAIWPRYGYPNDLIGALSRAGLSVRDVPVRPVYRGEASGLRPWHLITITYLIARVAYRRVAQGGRARA